MYDKKWNELKIEKQISKKEEQQRDKHTRNEMKEKGKRYTDEEIRWNFGDLSIDALRK